jgi:hypothetical protein
MLRPELDPASYVFVSVPAGTPPPAGLSPLLSFVESEGATLIIESEAAAGAGLSGNFPCRRITLQLLTKLEDVGVMAAASSALACNGIPVNPVAGFYHDHLFVPENRAEEALAVLRNLMVGG